jgi:hypothetical protein
MVEFRRCKDAFQQWVAYNIRLTEDAPAFPTSTNSNRSVWPSAGPIIAKYDPSINRTSTGLQSKIDGLFCPCGVISCRGADQ